MSNINTRAYIHLNPFYVYIYTNCNLHLFLPVLVLSTTYLINLSFTFKPIMRKILFIFKNTLKNFCKSINKTINLILARRQAEKSSANLLDKFLKDLHLQMVPKSFRNLNVFMAPKLRSKITGMQRADPRVVGLLNDRERRYNEVRTSSNTISNIGSRLLELIRHNGLVLYQNVDGSLAVEFPNRMTPATEQMVTRELVAMDVDIRISIDQMTNSFNYYVQSETDLRSLGVEIYPRDLSIPLSRARTAFANYDNLIIRENR
jgi:hypothetical protein